MAAYSCNHVPRAERTMEWGVKKRAELKEKILCGSSERKGPSALATNRETKGRVLSAQQERGITGEGQETHLQCNTVMMVQCCERKV